jgi:intein/homing endonuclease
MVELMQNAKAVIAPLIPPYGEIFGLCVHPDTEIDTDKGTVAISNLNGARVLSGDGLYHEVKAKASRPYKGELIKILPSGISLPIKTTPEHPYWAMRRHSQRFFTAPEWVSAKDLKKGDMLLAPMLQEKAISNQVIHVPSYKILER